DFHKDSGLALRKECARFVELCREMGLLATASVAIDSRKFKACNDRDKRHGGSTSTCSKPCRGRLDANQNRCASVERQSNIPSARSRLAWEGRTSSPKRFQK